MYYSSGRVICQRVMTNEGDRECSCSPRAPLPPPRIYRSQGPGFRPAIPRASLNRHTPGSPRGDPEVLGCSVGTSGSRARRANPHPQPQPGWPLSCPLFPAARDFCGVMVTWRFRHGVFQAPCQGPETPPLWTSLWVAGCQPNPEPLSPAGPRACQAA